VAAKPSKPRLELPPLALTQGDPAGIGPDILLMTWQRRAEHSVPAFVVFGDPAAIGARAKLLGIGIRVAEVADLAQGMAKFATAIPVRPVPLVADCAPGHPDPANGRPVISTIEEATAAVARSEASAVVTNPIAKSVLYSAGFSHPGHTEFLAELARRHFPGTAWTSVMMLASDVLRVVPLTIHIPLASVPAAITGPLIEATARVTAQALALDFGIANPRLAVAGLNPHGGEGGAMGTEDRDVIAPAIAGLQREGLAVTGPHSADTLFHAEARKRYDAAIAMYHDQALVPIKTLAFDRAVNVTLGLPFVRTSPDHGTAFNIAGTGRASPESLIAALQLAAEIAERRARSNR